MKQLPIKSKLPAIARLVSLIASCLRRDPTLTHIYTVAITALILLIIVCCSWNNCAKGDQLIAAEAGSQVSTANNVISVGAGVLGISGVAGEVDNSCYVGNIYNAPVHLNTAVPVLVDQDGKLGTQGFDGKKVALPLPSAHPLTIDEEETRISALESKIARQHAKIEQQQKQLNILTVQLKNRTAAIDTLATQIKRTSPFAKGCRLQTWPNERRVIKGA